MLGAIVHRDIKPANIHVGHVGIHDDFVKVLDFGLVKAVGPTSEVSLGARFRLAHLYGREQQFVP